MATRSVSDLLTRLSKAGFKREFVRPAILPDWWEDSLESDVSLITDIELRVARFLGLSVAQVRDPDRKLTIPEARSVVLRKAPNIKVERLRPAIHAARRIGEAVVRNLRAPGVPTLPVDPREWRDAFANGNVPVTLDMMLADLWARGVPVIPTGRLPSPTFQGMATVIEERPVIIIGQKHDAPGRVGFFVAHEAGHIANNDCGDGSIIVDEEESSSDRSEIEIRADRYASRVLLNDHDTTEVRGEGFSQLAESAYLIEQKTGAEAGALLFHWARKTGDYQTATMAVRALYRHIGAQRQMIDFLARNVDIGHASETDRALLGLALGDAASAATAD